VKKTKQNERKRREEESGKGTGKRTAVCTPNRRPKHRPLHPIPPTLQQHVLPRLQSSARAQTARVVEVEDAFRRAQVGVVESKSRKEGRLTSRVVLDVAGEGCGGWARSRAAREQPLVEFRQSCPHSAIISSHCACLNALRFLGRSLPPSTSPDASADSSLPSPTTSNNSLLLAQLALVSLLSLPSYSLHSFSRLLRLSCDP
jgi:hypothetical protein